MKTKLNPGDILCDKCYGNGTTLAEPNKNMRLYPIICTKCKGKGKT